MIDINKIEVGDTVRLNHAKSLIEHLKLSDSLDDVDGDIFTGREFVVKKVRAYSLDVDGIERGIFQDEYRFFDLVE